MTSTTILVRLGLVTLGACSTAAGSSTAPTCEETLTDGVWIWQEGDADFCSGEGGDTIGRSRQARFRTDGRVDTIACREESAAEETGSRYELNVEACTGVFTPVLTMVDGELAPDFENGIHFDVTDDLLTAEYPTSPTQTRIFVHRPLDPEPSCDIADGLELAGRDLSGCDLYGANLDDVDLTDVDLTNTDLGWASLDETDLSNANLDGADLAFVDLRNVIWHNTTCPDGTNSNDHDNTCQDNLISN